MRDKNMNFAQKTKKKPTPDKMKGKDYLSM
jgi:hypothetical protein